MTVTGTATESRSGRAFAFVRGATGPLIGLVLLCVFLSFSTDTFLSMRNFLNVMDQITVLGVMAVGMTLVILIGGIDLSVGSVLALSGMVMGYLGKQPRVAVRHRHSRRARRLRRLRPDVGPDGDPPPHAGLHRDARDDVNRSRHREHHHQRRTDRRLSRLVLQSRDHPPFRFSDRDCRLDGRHHGHCVDCAFLSSSRAGALRPRRQSGSRAAGRHSGPPIHDVGLRHMRRTGGPRRRHSFSSTRLVQPAQAWATNWTPLPPSSSEAQACRAASGASAARPSAS